MHETFAFMCLGTSVLKAEDSHSQVQLLMRLE